MRKNNLFLLSGLACVLGAGVLTAKAEAKPQFIEEIKKAVGGETLLIEAESGYITGTPHVDGHDFVEVGKTSDNPAHPTSGGDSVGYWATAGNKMTWTVLADNAVSGVGMEWWMSNGDTSTKTLDESLKVTVNGNAVAWTTQQMQGRDGNKWANWTSVTGGEATFKKGRNIIVLENIDGMNAALDSLELHLPTSAQGNYIQVETDRTAPTLANLGVEGSPKVGDQVTIKYDLTDDINTKEECKVELTVTFEKGTRHSQKIAVENNKFTAEKGGKYTISAIAKDETGNETDEIIASVQIGEYIDDSESSSSTPTNTPSEGTPSRYGQLEASDIAIFAVGGLIVAGIIFGIVFSIVKKAKKKKK